MRVEGGSLVVGNGGLNAAARGSAMGRPGTAREGSHRKAIVLASMFKRIPNDVLEKAEGKKPSCFAVQKVPWREDGKHEWEGVGRGKGDKRFAVWERQPLRKGCSLDDALYQVECANQGGVRVLVVQVMFEDGSRMRFARSDVNDPSTLVCKEFYTTVGRAAQPAEPRKPIKFLVNSRGHLVHRRPPAPGTNSLSWQPSQQDPPNTNNFAFTPVGFLRHQVRPNAIRPGLRPGLRESSSRATEFRPRVLRSSVYTAETMGNMFVTSPTAACSPPAP